MKISTAAVTVLASLPVSSLAQQCLSGSFSIEFDGSCTPEAVLEAYADQVFHAAGATDSSCDISAEDDLNAKLSSASLSFESLCKQVYDTQEKVPFTEAARRGTDMQFEEMFFNGRTDWQEEVETIYETEDRSATSILEEDAEQVRVFHDGTAQGQRVAWPGSLTNFQSSVTDADGLATCTTNAAMCCWPQDRQANDNNGNCAKAYDENCVDKDPADNTNLCFVDLAKGNQSTEFDSSDVLVYPGDNNQGEGAIHCHGLAWSNDVNHHTARYKANNMFYVSMYDHMYQRGYVQNVPGAPMCGCVEQMPTVSRSDCTQVDLTETIKITFHADTTEFKTELVNVHVDFNSCQGINDRNNDLWAYMARLYYEGEVTAAQFGELGRSITNTGCDEATQYELNKQGLTPGYDHEVAVWTNVAGRESMKLHEAYGHRAFTKSLVPGSEPGTGVDPATSHYGIIYRACQPCVRTHKKVFYRRRTPIPDDFNLIYNILHQRSDGGGNNVWDVDFSLHSSYDDAVNDVNPWKCPNDTYDYSQPFSGRCSPDGSNVSGQYSRFTRYSEKHNVAYYANSPEDDIFEILPSTAIKGRDYASGIALKDKESGAIYMTGSGRDIWSYNDDFNYMSEPVDGDHTVIVHAGSISSPDWHDGSKSGIMFRSTLAPNSAHYSLLLKGSGYVCPSSRKTTGSHTSGWDCVNVGAPEAWLKVEKRMSTYTSYVGTQEVENGPITWTVVHTKELPGIGDSYNVGLAVTSQRSWSKAQEVIFTDYEVDAYYFPSAAPSTSLMPTIFVPSTDIGAVGIPGTARQNDDDGAYVISASGSDIWGSSDEFHYVHFAHTGDIKAELLVDSFDYVYSWQKGGIMFRETLDAGSKHLSFYTTGSRGVSNQWRGSTNGNSGSNTNGLITTKPIWLQITKVGNVFTSAYKLEGDLEWTVHYEKTISTFADNFFVGIAVTSHRNDKLATLVAPELIIEEIAAPTTTVPPARRLRKMKGSE